MELGICKLCGVEKELIGESHAIPQFMYREIIGDDKKVYRIGVFAEEIKINKKGSPAPYDKHIFCQQCEGIFSKYESYAKEAIYGIPNMHFENPQATFYRDINGRPFTIVEKINYKKYKLFLLSLLFKAHVSKQKIFEEVNIGIHIDKIKKMILDGNAGEDYDYPIMHFLQENMRYDLIIQPLKKVWKGVDCFQFTITKMSYLFFLTDKKGQLDQNDSQLVLTKENKFGILHI